MEAGIYTLLNDDKELMDLYQTDAVFKKSIDAGYYCDMSIEKILIFALKNGYTAKQNIDDKYTEDMLHDRRPIKLETTNVCPKCKEIEILRYENNLMSNL